MSIIRNRELSQFGSFIYIDNNSQEIGIATDIFPYVGIGTTNPTVKFHVVGDTNLNGNVTVISGNVEASSYTLNGSPLVSASVTEWTLGTNNEIYRLNGNVGIGFSNVSQKLTVNGNVSAGQFISTVSSGTAPFDVQSNTLVTNLNSDFLRGKIPPNGDLVGTTDTQTLTNKTLISPIIISASGSFNVTNGIGVTGGIRIYGSTSGSTLLQSSAVASGTLTLPAATDTLVARNTTDTLTNKTISAGSNTITGITSLSLSASAGILNSQLANSTISGVPLGSNLANLTAGTYVSYNSGTTYNGSSAITVSVAATSLNTANTIVARNASGDFTGGTISASAFNSTLSGYRISGSTIIDSSFNLINLQNANFTGVVTCTSVTTTSDINLKENIQTIDNALDTVNSLRGVTFNWKENNEPSIGVVAQEVENILPELISFNGEHKSVNYNGIIGVLIESIKDLSDEIEELKKKIQ